ncbi:hypothetical protein TNCT_357061 [Trichonephila clavata]|uniref:Uncharacterized protein n=1 Tax=Trichonephila clavata TaxID=2740835 RepID=A0A8X6LCK6_TRICU|nr:hypothetical protein TNCT_357061 [Trichonephila clavata]
MHSDGASTNVEKKTVEEWLWQVLFLELVNQPPSQQTSKAHLSARQKCPIPCFPAGHAPSALTPSIGPWAGGACQQRNAHSPLIDQWTFQFC